MKAYPAAILLFFAACQNGTPYLTHTGVALDGPQRVMLFFSEPLREVDRSSLFTLAEISGQSTGIDTLDSLFVNRQAITFFINDTFRLSLLYRLSYRMNCKIDAYFASTQLTETVKLGGTGAVDFSVVDHNGTLAAEMH